MNRIGSTLEILFLVVSCDGYRNSSYMEQLLIKNNDRIPNAFRNLQEQPGGDNPFIDIIVSYLLRSADIPTAYSNKVSEQCKNDSLLYVEQATIQSLIPGANNWAPRSKICEPFHCIRSIYRLHNNMLVITSARIFRKNTTGIACAEWQNKYSQLRLIRRMPECACREREHWQGFSREILQRLLCSRIG